jgi:transcriptional regulator with XRE-family HTH domain
VGDRVRQARLAAGLSQRDLAIRIGVDDPRWPASKAETDT